MIHHLNKKSYIPISKFIVSSEWSTDLCNLFKDKWRKSAVYELNTKLSQSVRKSSNTWITFNNIEELFKAIFANLKKTVTTIEKRKKISNESEYVYNSFFPPLGIYNALSIPKLFHFLDTELRIFLLFQLLNKVIFQMNHNPEDLKDMWFFCRWKYERNDAQMNNINKLANEYNRTEAIEYYTTPTILSSSLNEVLRREDTDDMYAFRCYMSDLHNCLKELHEQQKSTNSKKKMLVYRGKKLPTILLQKLKKISKSKVKGKKLISINGFLSTTKEEAVAQTFAGIDEKRNGYESVIFRMHINEAISTTVPYAYIAEDARIPDEAELLFSLGSVWKLISVKKGRNAVWTIVLRLCNIFDDQLAEVHKELLADQVSNDYHLFLLAKILHGLGKYSQAGRFYDQLLEKQLSNGSKRLIHLYLASMKDEQGDYKTAQNHLEKILALDISDTITTNETNCLSVLPSCTLAERPSRMIILYYIGLLHEKNRNFQRACDLFKEVIGEPGNAIDKARVYSKLGHLEKLFGNNQASCEYLKQAVELAGNSSQVEQFKKDLKAAERLRQ